MLWSECPIECQEEHDGLIQRYVHLTREFEAPASFHVFSLLAATASATGRKVVIDRKGYRLWPNLYVLLHGPSGLGKGIASGHAIDMVTHAVGQQLRLYPEDLTGEGLFRIMHEQSAGNEPCVGLVYADEFADLLGGQQYKEEFAKKLTRLYACPDDTGVGRSGKGELWVKSVFLNIIGCSQEDWLRLLPVHAIKGGLFARIITVPEAKKRHWRYEPNVDRGLAHEIGRELAAKLGDIPAEGGVIQQTEAARKMGEEWYMGEAARWPNYHPIVKPFLERRLDHAIKLGYLNALLEGDQGPLVIDEDGLTWGLEAVEWLTPRIEAAFLSMEESQSGELNRHIMTFVKANGGQVKEQRIRQALGHKWRKAAMDEAFMHLISSGELTRNEQADGTGRTQMWVREVVRKEGSDE